MRLRASASPHLCRGTSSPVYPARPSHPLPQDGEHDVDFYIDEARRLFEPFEEVLSVLAKAADPTGETVTVLSNTKGREVSAMRGPGSRCKHGGGMCMW